MSKVNRFVSRTCLSAIVASVCILGWVDNAAAADYEAESWTVSAASPAAAATSGQTGSSGNAFVCFNSTPTSSGTYYIELTTPSLTAGTYSLSYLYKGHANRGMFQVSVDGVNFGGLGDQYAANQTNQMNMNVGNVTLTTSGTHRIRWTTNSKNSSSSGYQTAIDRITLTPTAVTTYTLATNATNGTITRSPNATSYAAGTVVTLTAVPNSGYSFSSWSGGASGSANPITVTMNSNISVTANFSTPLTYTLTTSAANGNIIRSPNATSYAVGTVVTLTATANVGYSFSNWSGGATGSTNPITVTMNSNISVTANFTTPTTYTLTTNAVNGTISRSPNATSYAAGVIVTLTASPNSGYTFSGWSGGVTGTANPTTVTMNSNMSVTATFTQILTPTGCAVTYSSITVPVNVTTGNTVILTLPFVAPSNGHIVVNVNGMYGTNNPVSNEQRGLDGFITLNSTSGGAISQFGEQSTARGAALFIQGTAGFEVNSGSNTVRLVVSPRSTLVNSTYQVSKCTMTIIFSTVKM